MNLSKRQQDLIVNLFPYELKSAELMRRMNTFGYNFSDDTLQRELKILTMFGLIVSEGAGPGRTHSISAKGRMAIDFSSNALERYLTDENRPVSRYDSNVPKALKEYLTTNSLGIAESATVKRYRSFIGSLDSTLLTRWRQKLLIEFAWKSSSIEGNTYSELETETLLVDKIEARGKTHSEATMIVNHQTAYDYIVEHKTDFVRLTVSNILRVHELIVANLDVSLGLRDGAVRISGSKYIPLTHREQIMESIQNGVDVINSIVEPIDKALASLLLISYLQPFADGNKRTARVIANAILESYNYPPLILSGIEPTRYRRACIIFYEMNNMRPMSAIIHDSYQNFLNFE